MKSFGRNSKILKCVWVFLLVVLPLVSGAQISVNSGTTASGLAQLLMGSGALVDSAKLTCAPGASASFTAQNVTSLPFDKGVLLTTGTASVNRSAANSGTGLLDVNQSSSGSPIIENVITQVTEDACMLEFRVKPVCNELGIEYIFGSEEYPDQVGRYYYDFFGFFISGVIPGGGTYTDSNIAVVPGTHQYVNVSSINNGQNNSGPCINCNYYINNSTNTKLGYDGLTAVLTAKAAVLPCTYYKIKLIIADVKDGKFDSGVFLKGLGVSCPGALQVTTSQGKVCKGQGVNINAFSNQPGYFVWNTGDTASAITVAPEVSADYTVTFYADCGVQANAVSHIEVLNVNGVTYEYPDLPFCKGNISAGPVLTHGTGNFTGSAGLLVDYFTGEIDLANTPAGTYNLSFTSSDSVCPIHFDREIKIYANTILSYANTGGYCNPDSVPPLILKANGTAPFNWQWKTGVDTVVKDSTLFSSLLYLYQPAYGTFHHLQVTDGNGCIANINDTLQKNNLSGAKVLLQIPDTSICANQPLVLYDSLLFNAVGTLAKYWYLNGNPVNVHQHQLSSLPIGENEIKLRVISEGGCADSCTKRVVVNSVPKAEFVFDKPCLNASLVLTNQSLVANTPSGFKWEFFDVLNRLVLVNNTGNAQLMVTDSVYTASLIVTDVLGCIDTMVKTITAYPQPVVQFNVNLVCNGDSLLTQNKSVNPSRAAMLYSWSVDGVPVSDHENLAILKSTGNYVVKLQATTENGCRNSLEKRVSVYSKPQVAFLLEDSAGCPPFRLKAQNVSSIQSDSWITQYKWQIGDYFSNSKEPLMVLNKPGNYVVNLSAISNKGCVDSAGVKRIIQVYPKPEIKFSYSPSEPTTLSERVELEFKNKADRYWVNFMDSVFTPDFYTANCQVSDSGWNKFTVVETNELGCKDTLSDSLYVKNEFTVYIPNTFTPNTDGLNDEFCVVTFGISNQDYMFRIMSRNNQEIFKTNDILKCWDGRNQEGSLVPNGVYVYEVKCVTTSGAIKEFKGVATIIR